MLTHWFACTLMIATTFAPSRLHTWMGTYGYCTLPEGMDVSAWAEELWRGNGTSYSYARVRTAAEQGELAALEISCTTIELLYLRTIKWAMGYVFHNGISMTPQVL